jgi:hypothetical protein
MTSPVDQTVIVPLTDLQQLNDSLRLAFVEVDRFVSQSAELLSECLDGGRVERAMIQGSRFCAMVDYDSKGMLQRGLMTSEELTVAMGSKLLTEGSDE